MTSKEAAAYLGISLYYLQNMRQGVHNHPGPKFTMKKIKNYTAAMYTKEDLDQWASVHKFRCRKVAVIALSESSCTVNAESQGQNLDRQPI